MLYKVFTKYKIIILYQSNSSQFKQHYSMTSDIMKKITIKIKIK